MINILLTSTINPDEQLKEKHHFPLERMGELVYNITYIARNIYESNVQAKFRIIIIDSSPNIDYFKDTFKDIKSLNENNINIKYLYLNEHLTQKDYLKGKGWCECKLINFACKKYPNDDLLKISGRYIYTNIDKIIIDVIDSKEPICTHNIYRKLTYTSIIYFPYLTWREYIRSVSFLKINDKNNFYLEHSIYTFLINKSTRAFKELPKLLETSRSGKTNIKYKRNLMQIFKNKYYPLFLNKHNKILRKITQ